MKTADTNNGASTEGIRGPVQKMEENSRMLQVMADEIAIKKQRLQKLQDEIDELTGTARKKKGTGGWRVWFVKTSQAGPEKRKLDKTIKTGDER